MARTDGGPAFTRLPVEERRRLLLERGRELFTSHPYDELSMAMIAREAGISKALLYHYFPSKQAYFIATLRDAAAELAARVRPDDAQPPRAQLDSALGEWLTWVDANRETYGRLLLASGAVAEVRELIQTVRAAATAEIIGRLKAEPSPALDAAVTGWLWMMDGVCLRWTDGARDQLSHDRVQALLADTLAGAVRAAGHPDIADRLS